jgi:hypothetical protein
MNTGENHAEHVVIIVDCSDDSWRQIGELANQEVSPTKRCNSKVALESIQMLQAAIQMFHADNRTTILAATLDPKFVPSVANCVDELITGQASIVKALTMALCLLNREAKEASLGGTIVHAPETRIVVVTATRIFPHEFVSCMNCAFAAQKMGVVVDVVDYSQSSTPELLQLVHQTNGWYLALSPAGGQQGSFAHALLTHFVACASARRNLNPPSCPATDMRTICFCHQNNLISIGFVCSVCLSVFCEKRNVCIACNSKVSLRKKA